MSRERGDGIVRNEAWRQRLLEEREAYAHQVALIDESGPGKLHEGGQMLEELTIRNHPGDIGSEMFEREKEMGLRSGFMRHIAEIDDALARMAEGTYGICEDCGAAIATARLEAMPSATTCIACQEKREALADQFHRPIEEQVLNPPFGRTFRANTGDPGYDGEDAWQEVAQHSTSDSPSDVPGAVSYRDLVNSDEHVYGIVDPMDGIVGADGDPLDGVAIPADLHVFSVFDVTEEESPPLTEEARSEDQWRTDHLRRAPGATHGGGIGGPLAPRGE
jgi:YteA family regulatory protein